MARVAVFCMYVWHCPHCDTSLKARGIRTVLASHEYHLLREHGIEPISDHSPLIEQSHWAFHVHDPEPVSA